MLKWLKSLFGFDTPDTPEIAKEPVAPAPAPEAKTEVAPTKKRAPRKTTTKKAAPKAGTAPKKRGRPKKT
jgi:hypothetical protein